MTTLRKWSITLVTAAVTAVVLLVPGILLLDTGGDRGRRAARGPVPPLAPPVSAVEPLGPARSPGPGKSSGGVPCGSREHLNYHVHARLTIFLNGEPRAVPLGVGIGPPLQITKTANGPFASGGSCFSLLHTHATDGIIHIEAPRKAEFTLGQFFDVWRQRLDKRHLGPATGRVVAYVNGRRYRGNPRSIPLRRHAQVQLEVAPPLVPPAGSRFRPASSRVTRQTRHSPVTRASPVGNNRLGRPA